jgi:Archaeal Peptidase A24 C-terminus Type II.
MLTNVLLVIMRYKGALEKLPRGYRIIVPLLGRPVKIRDYLNGKFKHYYPLQSFTIDGEKLTVKFRLVTGVNNAEIDDLRSIVERELLNPDDYIWITPGLPFILYLLIGFTLVLLVGDKPLLTLISRVI